MFQPTPRPQELPELLSSQLGDKLDTANASVTGHSMGGHGALVVGLKNPQVGGTWHVAATRGPALLPASACVMHTATLRFSRLADDKRAGF